MSAKSPGLRACPTKTLPLVTGRWSSTPRLPRRDPGGRRPNASLVLTDDPDTIELYFGSARQGRSGLWVHAPEEVDAKQAVRALADHQVLHIRHYGQDRQDDIHIA